MSDLSISDLQSMAVRCVEKFFNDNTPLSDSLCKEAEVNGLNSDQLQRAVEATNTLAYLKNLQMSADRTAEFPLADYRDIVKKASFSDVAYTPVESEMDKQASAEPEHEWSEDSFGFTRKDQMLMLIKEAQINNSKVERLTDMSEVARKQIIKSASELSTMRMAAQALSVKAGSEKAFEKLASLVFQGSDVKYDPMAEYLDIPGKSMEKAAELLANIQTGRKISEELKDRLGLQKRAESILIEGLEKEAGLIDGARSLFSKAVTKSVNFADKRISGAGNVLGNLTRGTVNTLLVNPAKEIGNAAISGAKVTADRVGTRIHNSIAGTELGKKVGMNQRVLSPQTQKATSAFKKNVAVAMTVGGGLADAASYHPGTTAYGQSKDVWDHIHD